MENRATRAEKGKAGLAHRRALANSMKLSVSNGYRRIVHSISSRVIELTRTHLHKRAYFPCSRRTLSLSLPLPGLARTAATQGRTSAIMKLFNRRWPFFPSLALPPSFSLPMYAGERAPFSIFLVFYTRGFLPFPRRRENWRFRKAKA
jgi:hypothetical protein